MRACVLATLFAALMLPAIPAFAEDRAAARRLFADGERAFAEARWDAALDAYTAAYEAAPLPGFLFNIGQCHRKLEHWEEAADFFRRYLAALPDAPNFEDAEDLLHEVEAQLSEAAPLPPPAPPPTAPPPTPPPAAPPSSSGFSLRPVTWISFGAGLALSAVAVGFALDLSAAQSAFDDSSLDCARRVARCRALRDRGDTAATMRTIFAAGALAALAAGGVFLVLDLRAPAEDREPAVALGLGPASASLEVAW